MPIERNPVTSPINTEEVKKALATHGVYRADEVDFGNDPHAFVLALGRQLGPVVPQYGEEVLELVPRRDAKQNGPFGYDAFPLHTDALFKKDGRTPDAIIMLCMHPGEGGEHLLVNGHAVIAELQRTSRIDIDALLALEIAFCHKGETVEDAADVFVLPVAPPQEEAGHLYRGPIYNISDARLRYATTLMNRIHNDFNEVSQAMEQSASPLQNVQTGSLWITDNKRILHGRKKILSPERKMLRVHLKLAGTHLSTP